MPNKPYIVRCLDAKYDEENEMLVLNCQFLELGEQRIIHMPRSNFHYKNPDTPVPHFEMHKTAALWKGKIWNFQMEDDPNRHEITEENQSLILSTFNKRITKELESVQDELSNDSREIERRLNNLRRKGKM